MNKRILVLCTLITVMLCVFTFTAFATGEVAPTTEVVAPVETTPEAPPADTPTTAPDAGAVDPVTPTTAPEDTGDGYYDDSYIEETVAPDAGYVETPTTSYVDSYTDENGYYYYDEEEMVNNIEDTAGNVSDYTNLYDTSNINDAELKKTEWDNITLSTSKGDATDFSSIKDNTETDDNGQWIIYTGLILIGLSLLGILYFVIATATYKKKLKKLKEREQRQRYRDQNRPRNDYGDSEDFPTQADYYNRYQRNRYTTSSMSYSERKRQKADTAEINLPRRYEARH